MRSFVSLACVFLASLTICSAGPPTIGPQVPTYQLNLDLPPEERWLPLVNLYKDKVGPVLDWIKSYVPAHYIVFPLIEKLLSQLDRFIGAPYADEMRSIATASGFDLGDVVLMNLFYEFTAGCTSIVAWNAANKTMYQGRNLDYDVAHLANITANVQFTRNGTVLYEGATFAGMVGLLTGSRRGVFSVSLDQRSVDSVVGVWVNGFEALFNGGTSNGFTIRSALETSATYAAALNTLSSTHLIAPSYLTIASGEGKPQGAVISRDRQEAVDVWSLDIAVGRWFLVETNYDHWKNESDPRGKAATYGMLRSSTEMMNLDVIQTVLNTGPVFNTGTVYQTVMSPQTGEYRTFVSAIHT